MHRKQVRAAARTAALGGTLVLGLGSAQAAMAQPPVTVHVACYAGALASANGTSSRGAPMRMADDKAATAPVGAVCGPT